MTTSVVLFDPDDTVFAHRESVELGIAAHRSALGGGAHAGLRGVWIDRHRLATPDEIAEATAEGIPRIRSLAELPALLA